MPMRISLCNEVIRELPIERQFEFARKVGYDGLEIEMRMSMPRQLRRGIYGSFGQSA